MADDLALRVAYAVMGFREDLGPDEWPHWFTDDNGCAHPKAGDYSTDMSAAMEVVAVLHANGLYVSMSKPPDRRMWDVRGWDPVTNTRRYIAHAESLPEAICKAALKAFNAPQPTEVDDG